MKIKKVALSILGTLCLMLNNPLLAQDFSLSTNIIDYLNFGTINGEVGLSISQKWSLSLSGKYNPFTFTNKNKRLSNGYNKQKQSKQLSFSAGGRYWPWYVNSGWFILGEAGYSAYNWGGIVSETTYQGDLYGATIGGGYALMLSKNLNIEFGAGVMLSYTDYIKYACPKCGERLANRGKFFVMPNNILLQLTYLF